MLNTLFIVWRESLEAMLVIGVLMAWINRQPEPSSLKRGVWVGAIAGIALALALGAATFVVQSQFAGESLEIFQLAMVLMASGLIVQMVLWMRRHGRMMKRELEAQAAKAAGALGVGTITALAIAREGAETVVFLYGAATQAAGASAWGGLALAALAGLALALSTSWVLERGARFLNYATVFRISEAALLIIAGALLVGAVDRMISMDWLPSLMEPLLKPVWDTSALLNDGEGPGRVMADFLGYRARPAAVLILIMSAFWAGVWWRLQRAKA
jgi:high-affinity iron transporter